MLNQLLLQDRYPLDGGFNPQITASYHDPVRRVQDAFHLVERPGAFDLCYDKWTAAEGRCCLADCLDICRGLYKGLTYRIDSLFHCKSETIVIPDGECSDA